jgi:chemotaxis protein MotA
MLFHVGMLIVLLSIIGGYIAEGGNLFVLFQPFAALIIMGSALGIFIISNPQSLLRSIWKNLPKIFRSSPYSRWDYIELLVFMFSIFRFARSNSILALEEHIENPYKSSLFKQYPKILAHREAVVFFCDYMRMLVLGYDNTYELENMMQEQINARKEYSLEISNALYRIADTLPALGILAAVLGVINAMGSIDAPADVLGHKIGAALIGTFFGVAISYCVFSPIASNLQKYGADEAKFLECIKAGFIAHSRGNPPSISVEFARQVIAVNLKPSFNEVEQAIENRKATKKVKKYGRRESEQSAAAR